jgi:hypothetical protein
MAVVRFAKQALIGALAVIGALYLGFHALVWMFFSSDTAPSSADIAGSILSPDGRHKVVVFLLVGPPGGGIQERVGIIPMGGVDATAWADRNNVFHSSCGALGETLDDMRKNVVWKSAEALEITFNPNRGCAINLKDYAGERAAIRVHYVLSGR